MEKNLHIFVLIVFALLLGPAPAQTSSKQKNDTTTVFTLKGTYYSDIFIGRKTSSGEVFSQSKFTAAHRSWKFGTLVRVTNPKNGKSVIVKINDRCKRKGIIDLSKAAARKIGISKHTVKVQILSDEYRSEWEQQQSNLSANDTVQTSHKPNNKTKKAKENGQAKTDTSKTTTPQSEPSKKGSTSASAHNDSLNIDRINCGSLPIPEY